LGIVVAQPLAEVPGPLFGVVPIPPAAPPPIAAPDPMPVVPEVVLGAGATRGAVMWPGEDVTLGAERAPAASAQLPDRANAVASVMIMNFMRDRSFVCGRSDKGKSRCDVPTRSIKRTRLGHGGAAAPAVRH
jgi:hypothetical protein